MPRLIKFVSLLCTQRNLRSSKSHLCVNESYHLLQFLRFCRTERALDIGNCGNLHEKKYASVRSKAQDVLLVYFHVSRNMHFLDSENMSKNSPEFLNRLLKEAGIGDNDDDDVGNSLRRFICFHPINEFEPFFESIGLKPSEYASLLPPNLMFLSDDELLLHNYHVLCNYGIANTAIGKIYKEAKEVFRYDHGILQSELQSFQNLGLPKSFIGKTIASSPNLLKGAGSLELLLFLDKLKDLGIGYEWLEEHMLVEDSYNWKTMLDLMCFLGELGLNGKKLREVITKHPDLLLERSGHHTFRIFVFLLKFGSIRSDLQAVSLQFPRMPVVNFINNSFNCYKFLAGIEMSVQDIGRMFHLYPLLLGSCKLKPFQVVRDTTGYKIHKIRRMVKDDPLVLKKWVMRTWSRVSEGIKYKALKYKCQKTKLQPDLGSVQQSQKMEKSRHDDEANLIERQKERLESRCVKNAKFLLSLGFDEESKKMEKVLQRFKGDVMALQEMFDCLVDAGLSREDVIAMLKKAPNLFSSSKGALQERFDCLVDAGLSREDVIKMVKRDPSIFCCSKGEIERKIDVFVKELGYPLSEVVTFPELIRFSSKRIKLRLLMYNWLIREGVWYLNLGISTVLSLPERTFVTRYVNLHRRGPEYWERLKETIYSI